MIDAAAAANPTLDFIQGGGEMGARLRAHDWSRSTLGPPERWPAALRTAVRLMLNTGHPMYIFWGADGACLYNDAYSHSIGPERHPGSLGKPAREVWAEIWPVIGPQIDQVMAGRGATWHENQLIPITRHGKLEDVYWTYSYSPIDDATARAGVGGVLVTVTETTEAVTARQRQAFRIELEDAIAGLEDPQAVMATATELLGRRLGVGRCGYGEIDGGGASFTVERDWTDGQMPSLAGTLRLRDFGPGLLREWREGRTVRLDDPLADERTAAQAPAYAQAGGMRAGMAAPLIKDGRFVAALYVHQTEPRRWTDAEEELLREVAERTWSAVQRARSDTALRQSEARLRTVLESMSDGYFTLDAELRLLSLNAGAAAYFNFEPGAMIGRRLDEMFPGAEDTPHYRALTQAIRRGAPTSVEAASVGRPGRTLEIRSAPSGDGGATIAFTDVTERRQAETRRLALLDLAEAIRELEDPEALSFEAARIMAHTLGVSRAGYGAIDPRLETIDVGRDWNAPGVSSLAGRLHFRDYGSYIADLKRGETVVCRDARTDPRTAANAAALEAIGARSFINMPLTEQGGFVALAFVNHAEPRDWSADDVAFVREIAERLRTALERRRAEQDLAELAASLEQQVSERTAELMQAQEALRQSQKLEAMGQLTGGVAHDFNNLLTPIIGSLDLLQRRALGGEREQRLIDGALQSAERAKTLVQRLLAFARRQPLQPAAVDVAALIAGMADLIASTSGPQIRVQVEAPPDLPAARADANQLEMAILNLSVNARDAMPEGGALHITAAAETVTAGHRSGLRSGSYVRIGVADTGAGMDEATLARAIEPFFSTKGVGKGTGLGLSMVHGLASQLGGVLKVSSRPGLGTNVELWLPTTDRPARLEAEVRGAREPAIASGTALLVDDEDLVRASTADMLAELGYAVVAASSAEEALRLVDGGLVADLLVTDHLMPGLSGADLARAVRERLPRAAVLVISGYAEVEGIAPDLARLTKPFRQADLAASVAEVVAQARR